jgi:hypothetical protein
MTKEIASGEDTPKWIFFAADQCNRRVFFLSTRLKKLEERALLGDWNTPIIPVIR